MRSVFLPLISIVCSGVALGQTSTPVKNWVENEIIVRFKNGPPSQAVSSALEISQTRVGLSLSTPAHRR